MDVCIIHAYPMVQELLAHWVQLQHAGLTVARMTRPPQVIPEEPTSQGPRLIVLDDDTLPLQSALPIQRLRGQSVTDQTHRQQRPDRQWPAQTQQHQHSPAELQLQQKLPNLKLVGTLAFLMHYNVRAKNETTANETI